MMPVDATPLAPVDKVRLAAEIAQVYVAARWWMRRDLPDTVAAARRKVSPDDAPTHIPTAAALRLGRIVERVLGRLPFDSRCFVRSLVLIRLLNRRGVDAALVIGVATTPRFVAHAWVELDGIALLPAGSGFERLAEL